MKAILTQTVTAADPQVKSPTKVENLTGQLSAKREELSQREARLGVQLAEWNTDKLSDVGSLLADPVELAKFKRAKADQTLQLETDLGIPRLRGQVERLEHQLKVATAQERREKKHLGKKTNLYRGQARRLRVFS